LYCTFSFVTSWETATLVKPMRPRRMVVRPFIIDYVLNEMSWTNEKKLERRKKCPYTI
jgi:hypothetical protein